MQLYFQLRDDIVSGVVGCGEKLPSKRLMAEETGVSVITVEHAYALLCDEGYAEARERSGYFCIYREGDFLSGRPTPPSHAFSAAGGAAQVPVGTFPYSVMARTVRRVLSDYGEKLLVKSPDRGCPELRHAIRDYLGRTLGMETSAEHIIIGSGAEYLYSMAVQLLGRDRVFALEDPSYEKIRRVYAAHGVKCDLLRMGSRGVESGELAARHAVQQLPQRDHGGRLQAARVPELGAGSRRVRDRGQLQLRADRFVKK